MVINYDFIRWIVGAYPEDHIKKVWHWSNMQHAYQTGTTLGKAKMKKRILEMIVGRQDRNPAMQKLMQEIEGLE